VAFHFIGSDMCGGDRMKLSSLVEELHAPVLRVAMLRAVRLPSPTSVLVLPCSALGSALSVPTFSLDSKPGIRIQRPRPSGERDGELGREPQGSPWCGLPAHLQSLPCPLRPRPPELLRSHGSSHRRALAARRPSLEKLLQNQRPSARPSAYAGARQSAHRGSGVRTPPRWADEGHGDV